MKQLAKEILLLAVLMRNVPGIFQQMLDDKSIKAIMCARGGYGAVRIIDQLKWEQFKAKPKWVIGFSDVTIFHSHINSNLGIASIHSKMCNSFPDDWNKAEPIQVETILSIRKALSGEKMKYEIIFNRKQTGNSYRGINRRQFKNTGIIGCFEDRYSYGWKNIICRGYG